MAGSDGLGGPPHGGSVFPPPADLLKPQVLEEREADQGHERVVVQPRPAPALVMVEPQLLLQLLVRQADCPATQGGRPCSQLHRALMAAASRRRVALGGWLVR